MAGVEALNPAASTRNYPSSPQPAHNDLPSRQQRRGRTPEEKQLLSPQPTFLNPITALKQTPEGPPRPNLIVILMILITVCTVTVVIVILLVPITTTRFSVFMFAVYCDDCHYLLFPFLSLSSCPLLWSLCYDNYCRYCSCSFFKCYEYG